MKHIGKIIGLIILALIIFGFIYTFYSFAPCRIAPPPDKLIIGSKITDGTYPDGTWWVSDGNKTYTGYIIDIKLSQPYCILFCKWVDERGSFPNGYQYANITLAINPNIPKWCYG